MARSLLAAATAAAVACIAAGSAPASTVSTPAGALFFENFAHGQLGAFVKSTRQEYVGQPVEVAQPAKPAATATAGGDYGLLLAQPAKRYAVTAPFSAPVAGSDDKPFVFQYEVRLQEGLTCGGAYVKLLNATSERLDAAATDPHTPYLIMFGPDRCGSTDKVHLIIRWRNPVTGVVEERHLAEPPRPRGDSLSHVYTLVIRPDDTFAVKIDGTVEREGSLASPTDFTPPILPPREIDDPTDSKPADWVDAAEIPDPEARKPEDWDEAAPETILDEAASMPAGWLEDEPDYVPDPAASVPEGWDEEEDGVWEAPTVRNPKCDAAPGCGPWQRPSKKNPAYKGRWAAPLVPNPAYKGVWKARQVPNPAFFTDDALHRLSGGRIGGVAVEVWTMNGGIWMTDFLVGTDEAAAAAHVEAVWRPRHAAQKAALEGAERSAGRAGRLAAAEAGGVAAKAVFWAYEVRDIALDNPIATIATVATAVLGSVFAAYRICCAGGLADNDDEEGNAAALRRARAKAAAQAASASGVGAAAAGEEEEAEGDGHGHSHSHSHSHGGHSHGHDGDGSDGDEAEAEPLLLAQVNAAAAAASAAGPDSAGSRSGAKPAGGARRRRPA